MLVGGEHGLWCEEFGVGWGIGVGLAISAGVRMVRRIGHVASDGDGIILCCHLPLPLRFSSPKQRNASIPMILCTPIRQNALPDPFLCFESCRMELLMNKSGDRSKVKCL